MKAILHIGTEKTGTTTIQEFLHINRSELQAAGVYYPTTPGLRNHRNLATACLGADDSDDHTQELGLDCAEQREAWRSTFARNLEGELRGLSAGCETVLFSSEHLQSRLTTVEAITRLKSLLAPYFDEFQVILYLRRQDEVAVSRYSTVLRAGYVPQNVIPPIRDPRHGFYNYLALANRWSDVFGADNLSVRVFSRSDLVDGDVVSDLCAAIGHPEFAGLKRPERQNETLSASAQRCLLQLNKAVKLCESPQANHQWATLLRRQVAEHLVTEYPGKPQLPPRADAERLYALFRESNHHLARQFLGRESLFDEDFSRYPAEVSPSALDEELVTYLLSLVMSIMASPDGLKSPDQLALRVKRLLSKLSA